MSNFNSCKKSPSLLLFFHTVILSKNILYLLLHYRPLKIYNDKLAYSSDLVTEVTY